MYVCMYQLGYFVLSSGHNYSGSFFYFVLLFLCWNVWQANLEITTFGSVYCVLTPTSPTG